MRGPSLGAGMKAFACDQAQRQSVALSALGKPRTAWLHIVVTAFQKRSCRLLGAQRRGRHHNVLALHPRVEPVAK